MRHLHRRELLQHDQQNVHRLSWLARNRPIPEHAHQPEAVPTVRRHLRFLQRFDSFELPDLQRRSLLQRHACHQRHLHQLRGHRLVHVRHQLHYLRSELFELFRNVDLLHRLSYWHGDVLESHLHALHGSDLCAHLRLVLSLRVSLWHLFRIEYVVRYLRWRTGAVS